MHFPRPEERARPPDASKNADGERIAQLFLTTRCTSAADWAPRGEKLSRNELKVKWHETYVPSKYFFINGNIDPDCFLGDRVTLGIGEKMDAIFTPNKLTRTNQRALASGANSLRLVPSVEVTLSIDFSWAIDLSFPEHGNNVLESFRFLLGA